MTKGISTTTLDKLTRFNQEAEERDAQRRAVRQGLPYINLRTIPIEIEALKLIPEERARKIKAAAVNLINKELIIAAIEDNQEIKEEADRLTKLGYQPKVLIGSLSGLQHVWSFFKYVPKEEEGDRGRVTLPEKALSQIKGTVKTLQDLKKIIEQTNWHTADITSFLATVLGGALALGASDIHIENERGGGLIRLRLDGMLYAVLEENNLIPPNLSQRVVARLKLLAGLKLNITNETQDGRFTVVADKQEIEIRLAVAPSEYGEVAVMRLLNPEAISIGVKELGFLEHDLNLIREQLKKPNGLLLNTGPTGSGKTTTLYAFLKEKTSPTIKVITIEDPIEYHLEGLEQTQVDEESGYTFASGLKSLLRQDPDVILVGEIRDEETAGIAIDASLTGHLVFSTLHTNDATGALPRLIDLGVRVGVMGSALNLIIAQRLVRKLCPACREKVILTEENKIQIKNWLDKLPPRVRQVNEEPVMYQTGTNKNNCTKCNGTGYKGRMGIFELLEMTEDIQGLLEKGEPLSVIKNKALEQGMITMQDDGLIKVLAGKTSLEEVERITGVVDWEVDLK